MHDQDDVNIEPIRHGSIRPSTQRQSDNNIIKLYPTIMSDKVYPPVKQSTNQTEEEQVNTNPVPTLPTSNNPPRKTST
jgi:hypothetical protein